jgi:hypothetical protein
LTWLDAKKARADADRNVSKPKGTLVSVRNQ